MRRVYRRDISCVEEETEKGRLSLCRAGYHDSV